MSARRNARILASRADGEFGGHLAAADVVGSSLAIDGFFASKRRSTPRSGHAGAKEAGKFEHHGGRDPPSSARQSCPVFYVVVGGQRIMPGRSPAFSPEIFMPICRGSLGIEGIASAVNWHWRVARDVVLHLRMVCEPEDGAKVDLLATSGEGAFPSKRRFFPARSISSGIWTRTFGASTDDRPAADPVGIARFAAGEHDCPERPKIAAQSSRSSCSSAFPRPRQNRLFLFRTTIADTANPMK